METTDNPNSETTSRMLEQAVAGDAAGWNALVARFHDRLRRMVAVRLDPRLQGRFDPSDVLQETYLEVARRVELLVLRHAGAPPAYHPVGRPTPTRRRTASGPAAAARRRPASRRT